jgi:hypothetical protein
MSFEVIDRKIFAEVLYPKDIYDPSSRYATFIPSI